MAARILIRSSPAGNVQAMNKLVPVSPASLFVLQVLYFGASAGYIYSSLVIRSTASAYWIPILLWGALALFGAWLYSLVLNVSDAPLMETIRSRFGLPVSLLLIAPLVLFMGGSAIVMLRAYTEMISMTMLPSTPIPFLNGLAVVAVFMAWAGIKPIVRAARVFFLITLFLSIVLMLMGLSDIDLKLGSPWLLTSGDFIHSSRFYGSSYLWTGFVFAATLGPYSGNAMKKFWRPSALAILFALPLVLCVVYLPILTFGPELCRHLVLPYVSEIDTIFHYWVVLENLTAVYVSNTMIYVLLALSLKLHALGRTVELLFPSWNKNWIYLLLGAAVYAAAIAVPSWQSIERWIIDTTGLRMYAMFGFPLLILAGFTLYSRITGKEGSQ